MAARGVYMEYDDVADEQIEITRPHISYSQIAMFNRCPEQWKQKYMHKVEEPLALSTLKGSSYHRALEEFFKNKVVTGCNLPLSDVIDVYLLDFNQQAKDCVDSNYNEERESGIRLLKAYLSEPLVARMQPIEVEKQVTIRWNDELDLVGIIDLVLEDGTVVDHKTASTAWAQSRIDKDFQSSVYAMLLGKEELDMEFHIVVANKTPKIQVAKLHRDKEALEWTRKMINSTIQVMELVRNGLFLVRTDSWNCSEKYCGNYYNCMPKTSGTITTIQ